MFAVTLSNSRCFDAASDSSILDAARLSGIVLEHSCRTGRCGACKATVISGETKALRPEESLTADEIKSGQILTCCRAATSDISLDIEDLGRLAGVQTRIFPCRIRSIERISTDILRVMLRLPPNAAFTFLPGQYIDIQAAGVRRSYSIANAPRADNSVELHIRRFENGIMSQYWFEEAKPEDLLRFEAPLGTFFLRDNNCRNLVFLATGTGIAPVKAMVEEMAADPSLVSNTRVSIYWGNRRPEDFYWRPAEGVVAEFHPVLSGSDPNWTGRRGYVQDMLRSDLADLSDASVYACGSPSMIASAKEVLSTLGLPPQKYYSDAFLPSN